MQTPIELIDLMTKNFYIATIFALLYPAAAVIAADSGDKNDPGTPTNVDKLVANQSATKATASIDPAADKPMTINFSDFVKDGAGCGVPNLDTSGK